MVEGSCHMVGKKMTVSCLSVSLSAILFCIVLVVGLPVQLNTALAKPSNVFLHMLTKPILLLVKSLHLVLLQLQPCLHILIIVTHVILQFLVLENEVGTDTIQKVLGTGDEGQMCLKVFSSPNHTQALRSRWLCVREWEE